MQYVNCGRMSLVGVTVLALFLTLASVLPLAAADNVPAIKTANTPVEGPFMNMAGVTNDATIGWSFTVGAADIVVSHLGLYDSGADGFLTAHQVGIWTSAGTPVTPATAIPIGTGATLVVDGYRYVAITPVTLNAGGTYVIGAYFPAVPQISPAPPPELQGDKIIYNSSQTYAAPITFGESRTTALTSTTDPLSFPNLNAGVVHGVFGPNFLCSFTELNLDNVTLNEGNASTTSFDFTVSLTQPAGAGGVTFDIATADGTTNPATAPSDYTAKSLTGQTIPAGSSTYTFSVLINGDITVEPNETFFVNVTNVTGAYLNDGQGLGTIINDDVATPEMDVQGNSISIADGDNSPASGDNTDFGSADVTSGTVSRSFTLHNTSGSALNLTGTPRVQISGAHAADFTVTLQPSSPVPTGTFTIFAIEFNPSAPGLRTATVSIDNNDSDENPYDFAIQGTGTVAVTFCPRSHGYWKNNPAAWPAGALPMLLGTSRTYTKTQLLAILNTPVGSGGNADASLILAYQLIAAKLNIAAGAAAPAPVPAKIIAADAAIAGDAIPIRPKIKPSTTRGRTMTTLASKLEDYNSGELNQGCCSVRKIAQGSDGLLLNVIPESVGLEQNFPNPFNPTTTIQYALPNDARVTLDVYDVLGRRVAELVNGQVAAGYHAVEFNATSLASGMYFYRLNADEGNGKRFTQIRKLMLMK